MGVDPFMYTEFFGLKEKPFEITPDPQFLFLSESHREALAHMTYAARERKGFTVITGEVGTGKTTLVNAFLNQLNGKVKTAYIFNPKLSSTDFLRYVCEEFGLKEEKYSKGQYIAQLHTMLLDHYSRNEQMILIIDEAQSLPPILLEEVRLLTNLETSKSKLLQVFLIGQPELNEVLNSYQFRQLKQRVCLRYHMETLTELDMKEYILKRLTYAEAVDTHLFTSKALQEIYAYSKGIPRKINVVCDNALVTGYALNQKVIGHRIIKEVIRKLEGTPPPKKKPKLGFVLWVTFLSLLFAFVFIYMEPLFSDVVLPWINGLSL
jgi:general secretion pathway protein A